jgi:hypothetical protein
MLHSFRLSAGCRFQAADKESKRLQCEQTECDVTEHGSVTISSISLSLKKDSSLVINSGEFNKLCIYNSVSLGKYNQGE